MPKPTMGLLAMGTRLEGMVRRAALGFEKPKPDIGVAECEFTSKGDNLKTPTGIVSRHQPDLDVEKNPR